MCDLYLPHARPLSKQHTWALTPVPLLPQRRPSVPARAPVGFIPGLQSSEAYYPNTTARMLRGASWERLLSRIGDALMMHLLLHGSIFLSLPNGCFLQVSGAPAPQVSRKDAPPRHVPSSPDAAIRLIFSKRFTNLTWAFWTALSAISSLLVSHRLV